MKIIPIKEREGKTCAVCEETKSVKYCFTIGDIRKDIYVCNKCALIYMEGLRNLEINT